MQTVESAGQPANLSHAGVLNSIKNLFLSTWQEKIPEINDVHIHVTYEVLPSHRISLPTSPMAMKKRSKESFGERAVQYRVILNFKFCAAENHPLTFLQQVRTKFEPFLACSYFETLQLSLTELTIKKLK